MERELRVGDAVVYVDQTGREYSALVTAVWAGYHGADYPNGGVLKPESMPSINVVIVSKEKDQTDNYGRQTRRETSIVHKSSQSAPAFFWKFSDE